MEYRAHQKLAPLYFGPFPIEDKIGKVAYKISLPAGAVMHPFLHVSQLKRKVPSTAEIRDPNNFPAQPSPVNILDRKTVKRGNKVVVKLLIQWSGGNAGNVTGGFVDEVRAHFPTFNLGARS